MNAESAGLGGGLRFFHAYTLVSCSPDFSHREASKCLREAKGYLPHVRLQFLLSFG